MNKHQNELKKGRKYDQVIQGARSIFMREGFEGASVDAIAKAAEVSKATLYSYFADKRELFLAVAECECLRQAEAAMELARTGQTTRETLTDIAQRLVSFFLSDFGQSVYRICVAESERFPELGRSFYLSGPDKARQEIANFLEIAVERGDLAIPDCRFAADQFAALCKADLHTRLIFNISQKITEEDVRRLITESVEMFLARYSTNPKA
ncbi:MAG: TetR/AcrR family transcriptional regulator [Mangrovicoccus sp.]